MKRRRRALLFMPGDDLHKIEKATGLDVDSIIMDLEDGVAFNRKVEARATTAYALQTLDFGPRERLVRINPVGSKLEADDLGKVLLGRPDGIVLPKTESAPQVQVVGKALSTAENLLGWKRGSIRILALIETALGVVNLREIADADPRLDALMFGAEDLAGDVGATRSADGREVYYAASAVVLAAAAFKLQAIDTVFVDLHDLEGLRLAARQALHMGYSGKMAIHPRQLDVINEVFTPSAEEVAAAERLLTAHDAQQAAGSGVFAYEGKMVDMPMIRAAQRVLARAGVRHRRRAVRRPRPGSS